MNYNILKIYLCILSLLLYLKQLLILIPIYILFAFICFSSFIFKYILDYNDFIFLINNNFNKIKKYLNILINEFKPEYYDKIINSNIDIKLIYVKNKNKIFMYNYTKIIKLLLLFNYKYDPVINSLLLEKNLVKKLFLYPECMSVINFSDTVDDNIFNVLHILSDNNNNNINDYDNNDNNDNNNDDCDNNNINDYDYDDYCYKYDNKIFKKNNNNKYITIIKLD